MKSLIRMSVVVALGAGLVACGGGGAKLAAGKENAAAALFQASGPASGARGAMASALKSGATSIGANGEVSVDCSNGGKAVLKFDYSGLQTGTAGDMTYDMTYQDCQEASLDGQAVRMNGTMKITMHFDFDYTNVTSQSGSISLKMVGKVDFSGAISDYIEANVTEYLDWSNLDTDSGSVTLKLDGTLKTSTDSYTYTQADSITVTAGTLKAASETSATGG
jgi:hypothetical protein